MASFAAGTSMSTTIENAPGVRVRPKYVPAVGPRLRWLLTTIFVLFAMLATVSGRPLAVGFADLVGFTRLGEELPPEELGRVAEQLVEIVQELVAPPVRMVKTIGDAVMLTSPDPVPLIDFGLRLCERVAERGPCGTTDRRTRRVEQ